MVMRATHNVPPRQRSPRTDSDLRDGDSAHGNPGEPAGDVNAVDSDTDVGDTTDQDQGLAGAGPERKEGFEELREEIVEDARDAGHGEEAATGMKDKRRQERKATGEQTADTGTGREMPIQGYRRLTIPEVIHTVEQLSREGMLQVLEFEKSHRNRKTLVARLLKMTRQAA